MGPQAGEESDYMNIDHTTNQLEKKFRKTMQKL